VSIKNGRELQRVIVVLAKTLLTNCYRHCGGALCLQHYWRQLSFNCSMTTTISSVTACLKHWSTLDPKAVA